MRAAPDSVPDPTAPTAGRPGLMPGSQVGSPWHADRVAEREGLNAELKTLYAEQDPLLAERPDAARMVPRPGHPVAECLLA